MTRTSRLGAMVVCALLSTAVSIAEPQRGGGSGGGGGGGQRTAQPRDGGGHSGGGGGGVHPAPSHGGGVYGGGGYYGGPYYARGSYVFVGGYFYDPFYGPYPWWPASAYAWGYYPVFDNRAEVRIQGTPRAAAVYVDGFYAGIVDDFDGTFQRLPLTPGGHRIELFLEGYRTVRKSLYLQPGSTLKLHETMTPLAAGETSERPEVAPAVPPPPAGTYTAPPGSRGLPPPPPGRGDGRVGDAEGFGTLVLHVQPREAEVSIDGQRWLTSGDGEFEIQLPAGRHRIEVELDGFQRFTSEVDVRDDGPTPVNISLTSRR